MASGVEGSAYLAIFVRAESGSSDTAEQASGKVITPTSPTSHLRAAILASISCRLGGAGWLATNAVRYRTIAQMAR